MNEHAKKRIRELQHDVYRPFEKSIPFSPREIAISISGVDPLSGTDMTEQSTYCTTTDTPPLTLDSIRAIIAKMAKLGPPPTPTGPGLDLQLSRDVFDFLLSLQKVDCGIPHILGAEPLSLPCGIGVQVNDLLPDGMIVGLTEAGREIVRDMKHERKENHGSHSPGNTH